GWPYRDNDASLQERSGRTAAQIADADGLAALHELERQVLDELLDEPGPAVVAAPASVATFADSPRLRARAFVVWLRASPEILAERASSGVHRPMPTD